MDKQERKLQIRTNTQQMEEIDHLMLLFPEHKFPDIARSCLLIELPMLEARPEQLQQAVDVLGNGFTESMDLRLGYRINGWVAKVARLHKKSVADVIRAAIHLATPLLIANNHLVDIVSPRQYEWPEDNCD
jgi:hypothetical protein